MSKKTVLVTSTDVPQSAMDLLSTRYNMIVNSDDSKTGLLATVPGVNAIFWSTNLKLDNDILDAAGPQLEIVATMSAGLDKFNIPELQKRGIKLTNTPTLLNASVADLAVMLLIGAARRVQEGRLIMENGGWPTGSLNQWMLGHDVGGSTVGIVGLGGIGYTIATRLKSFEVANFLYTGHKERDEGKQLGAAFVTLDELLGNSDFVIACVPLTSETKEMFNENAFSKMKKTAVFVNVSRGGVVDQNALITALKTGKIFAAGLDVMTPEPLPCDHELLKLKNCFIVPHIGSATVKTRTNMAVLTARNIINYFEGKKMLTPVC